MTASAEVVVVGAGPAGMAAAHAAASSGAQVLLLDEQPEPGGQVWREAGRRLNDPAAQRRAGDSDAGAAEALAGLENAKINHMTGATVIDATPDRLVSWLGPEDDGPRMRETQAEALIIATGAMERPVPFPGWTLPGVMGVGALQLLLKQDVLPKGRIVLAGQGPLTLLTFAQLRRAGANVAAILDFGQALPDVGALRHAAGVTADPKLFAKGAALAASRMLSGVPVHRSVHGIVASGADRIERVQFQSGKSRHELNCDLLAVHDGVIPNTQMTRLLGLDHDWSETQAAFLPRADGDGLAAPGIWVAGDGAGIGGVEIARAAGAVAGYAAAASLNAGQTDAETMTQLRARLKRLRQARKLVDAVYPPVPLDASLTGDTLVCRCEAITADEIRAVLAAGAAGPNRVKTYTRAGMGPCQGRMCGNALTRLIAASDGLTPDDVGALRIRPPLKPVLVGDYLPPEETV